MPNAARLREWNADTFVPTLGQVTFILSEAPYSLDAESFVFQINGVGYVEGTDFTVSGTTVTWLGFQLDLGDCAVARYII